MTNIELAEKVKDIALNYKTLYVMGCFGAPLTAANKRRYTQNHEYNMRPERTAMINAASADTFGFDCVCLIKGILWGWNGNKNKTYGGAGYAVNGVPDIGADSMIKVCKDVSADFNNIKIGEAVWCEGHIGVYIGDGLAVECTPRWDNNVQITACNRSVNGYNRRNWTKHGKLPYVTYENAEPTEPDFWEDENYFYWKRGVVKQLSKNFKTSEFECKGKGCCTVCCVSKKLVKLLQQIRDHFAKATNINSGYRCETHNKKVGGVTNSYHRTGEAADITVTDISPKVVAQYCESIGIKGIGLYETDKDGYFVHVDVRQTKSYWYGQAQKKMDTFQDKPKEEPKTEKPAKTVSEYKYGDIVNFTGTVHYETANSDNPENTVPGRAKVTAVCKNGKHPLHLRAINNKNVFVSGVYGWVDLEDVVDLTKENLKVGDIVKFTGNTNYINAYAETGKKTIPGRAKVTALYKKGKHPVHLRAINGDGKYCSGVYGWVDLDDIEV